MKKVVKRLFVYFLSMSLVLPNFSIPAYASEVSGNVEAETPEQVIENNNELEEVIVSENNMEKDIVPAEEEEIAVYQINSDTFSDYQKDYVNEITAVYGNQILAEEYTSRDSGSGDYFPEEDEEMITSGTFGASNGFRWSYDARNRSLMVTGEDEEIDELADCLPNTVLSNTRKIVFENCVVTGGSMSYMFAGFRGRLTSIDLSGLDTSGVTDMSNMFYWCSGLTNIDLSGLDTSKVTDMSDMFSWCDSLTSIDLSGLDTSKVTDMSYMFTSCDSLSSVDMSGLDISNVVDMSYMFSGCENLENIVTPKVMAEGVGIKLPTTYEDAQKNIVREITSVHCNKSLSKKYESDGAGDGFLEEDEEMVTTGGIANYQGGIFGWTYDESNHTLTITGTGKGANGLNQYIPDEIYDSMKKVVFRNCVIKGSMVGMFFGCDSLSNVDFSGLDTSGVTDMSGMFDFCESLSSVDLSNLDTSKVTNISEMFSGCGSLSSVNLSDLDTSNVTNMGSVFHGCSNLTSVDLSDLDTSNVIDMSGMFAWCESLSGVDVSGFDTRNVTDMSHMFFECGSLSSVDVSSFDTSKVTDMSAMFDRCSNLSSVDVSGFDTANVTDISYMFHGCESLISIDISSFDTSNVTDMSYMFSGCGSLSSVDISSLDTSNVTNMHAMFDDCRNLTSVDVSDLDTSNVTDMSFMFDGCSNLSSVDVSGLNTANVTDISNMFSWCENLSSVDISSFDTSNVTDMSAMFYCSGLENVDISSFDTSNVTDMSNMFESCSELTTIATPKVMAEGTSIELPAAFEDSQKNILNEITSEHCNKVLIRSGRTFGDSNSFIWTYDESTYTLTITGEDSGINELKGCLSSEIFRNVEKVVFQDCVAKGSMSYMFDGCESLSSVDLSGLDTSNVTNMREMFKGCGNLSSADLNGLDTSNVTDMHGMFKGCSNLSSVNLSSVDTSNVTNMESMFRECSNLSSVDASGFDTSNVTDMEAMFYDCSSLVSVDVSGFDTKNVTDMGFMFSGCSNLSSVDASGFDTRSVTDMGAMFQGCSSLSSVDVSGFDTRNVTDMGFMFSKCSNLSSVDVSGFDTRNVTDMGAMFQGCSSLSSVDVSSFDTTNVTDMSNMFYLSGLEKVDISEFNTLNVTDMSEMFGGCVYLTNIELGNLDTRKVTDMSGMFRGCQSMTSVNISGFDTGNVTNMSNMFNGCRNLVNVDISGFDTTNVDDMSNMFNSCGSLATIATPKVMAKGTSIKLPTAFKDSQEKIINEITSAHCKKILTRAKNEYDIVYALYGGVNNVNNPAVYNNSSETKLKKPKKTGYTFAGWYSDSKFTQKVISIPKGSIGTKTLYAKWTANKYNITFKGNGSTSGSMKKVSNCKYGNKYTLKANTFKRTGYTFTGWNTKADGSGTSYTDKASVENLVTKNGSTVTLYAQWKVKKYDIDYKLNGGKNSSKNPKSYTVKTSTITLKKPTKKGYKFVGWYSDKKLTKKVTKIKKGSTGNKTLYAKWKKK